MSTSDGFSATVSGTAEPSPLPKRPTVLEMLLDPRSIRWLLGSGGVLLVVGLVIWLASLGVFDNPWIVAGGIGTGTVGLMAGGWAVLKKTRFSLAGRAMTLLACFVMPLNLWFYQAHGLITIDRHLWMVALVCCALYAASALVLADSIFVYVLMGGVTMTGMLFLADMQRMAEMAGPATLLMVFGMIALHVERAFAPSELSPFSRQRFGLAFFWSGQALVVGSLALLAGAQTLGWLSETVPQLVKPELVPAIVSDHGLQVLAIVLAVCGAYAFTYSGVVVRKLETWMHLAAGGAVLMAAAGVLRLVGLGAMMQQAPILMLLPLVYLAASLLWRDSAVSESLQLVAHAFAGILLAWVVAMTFSAGHIDEIPMAIVCAEAAIFYAIVSILHDGPRYAYAAAALLAASLACTLLNGHVSAEYGALAFAAMGLAFVVAGRAARRGSSVQAAHAVNIAGHILISAAGVGTVLYSLARLADGHAIWPCVTSLGVQAVLSAMAAFMSDDRSWRRWYATLASAQCMAALGTVVNLSNLSGWQKLEIFSVTVGVLLLVVGHVTWWREQLTSERSGAASFCLTAGPILAGIPLLIATLVNRFGYHVSRPDELALLTVSLLMFVTGFVSRIRATTLVGGALLGLHMVMLIVSAGMRTQLAMGVYLTLGGAALFAAGVLLSIYRERLLSLPHRIREKQGLFTVLGWR